MDFIDGDRIIRKSFYRKMVDGDHSLAKTFWLYVIGSNLAIQLVYCPAFTGTSLGENISLLFICSLFVVWWCYVTLVGAWRSCVNSTILKDLFTP